MLTAHDGAEAQTRGDMRQMMAFQHLESDRLPELDQLFADDASIASWWAREYWIDEHAFPDDGSNGQLEQMHRQANKPQLGHLRAASNCPFHLFGQRLQPPEYAGLTLPDGFL